MNATPLNSSAVISSDVLATVRDIGRRARVAARALAGLPAGAKSAALQGIASALAARTVEILRANAADVAVGRERGLSGPLLDRLVLDTGAIDQMVEGVRQVDALPDIPGAGALVKARYCNRATMRLSSASRSRAVGMTSSPCLTSGSTGSSSAKRQLTDRASLRSTVVCIRRAAG